MRYDGRAHFKCQSRRYSESVVAMGYLLAPQRETTPIKCFAETLDS